MGTPKTTNILGLSMVARVDLAHQKPRKKRGGGNKCAWGSRVASPSPIVAEEQTVCRRKMNLKRFERTKRRM